MSSRPRLIGSVLCGAIWRVLGR